MKLSELTGRNVGTVLVATPGWDAFRSAAGVRTPMPVFFDAYNDAHHYRAENPLAHLHEDEAPVETDKLKSFH